MTFECPNCCETLQSAADLPDVVVTGAEPFRGRLLCACGFTVPLRIAIGKARRTTDEERAALAGGSNGH